jgi:6-pyruvoyltetrahydropterin/6-carboxytetrahydropterin synthase
MNYTVSVTRGFSAAHALRGYKGRCERLHGHNWKVRLSVGGKKLDPLGMVVDFTELRALLDVLLSRLDHHFLNEVPPFDTVNPTAENIAAHLFRGMKAALKTKRIPAKITGVEVWESEGSSATATE